MIKQKSALNLLFSKKMEDFGVNYFNFTLEEDYYPGEKQATNLYNESNKNEEQKGNSSTGGDMNNSNNQNIEADKKDNNDNHIMNEANDIYSNLEETINELKTLANKNINGEVINNLDILQYNNKIEPNQNKNIITENMSTINGNQILTSNLMINNKMQELFNSTEINYDNLKDMQMLKKKKKRRTKEAINKERNEKKNSDIIVEKQRGRLKKYNLDKSYHINGITNINHTRDDDDNIVKKINTFFLEKILNWLNNSFIDDNLKFQTKKFRKKNKQKLFAKLRPKLITNKVKKTFILQIINTKFKEIFSTFPMSPKYKKISPTSNKDLIDIIYKEKKQPFVIYILELTFLEGLNYFNGQISDEKVKSFFEKNFNYNKELINEFISKFDKIDVFLDDLYQKLENEKSKEEIKDYLNKINVLCLNYKQSFEKKYERKENKKKNK